MESIAPSSAVITPIRPTSLDQQRRYLRPADVAAITGASKAFVMKEIYAGRLRGYQAGRAWFIPSEAIDEWVQGGPA